MFLPDESQYQQTPAAVDAIGAQYFTGASGTLTIPAPAAGKSIYIRSIDIRQYATALTTASGTPALVTTTNLPNNPSIPMNTGVLAQGTVTPTQVIPKDLKASAPAVAVTFVFPAIANTTYYATVTYAIGL